MKHDPSIAPDRPRIVAWPPLLFTMVVLTGVFADRVDPVPTIPPRMARIAAITFLLVSFGLAGWAGIAMRRAGTPIHPSHPTTIIVKDGPYRLTRNPMYLALCLLACAIGCWVNGVWSMMSVPILWGLLHWGVVLREERYLEHKFGRVYREYRSQVRRWF